jgi:hypothetical protein
MKNIHILPTDKPSRLSKYKEELLPLAKGFHYGSEHIVNQNIYITNDEEIKEGDYIIDNYTKINLVQKVRKCDFDSSHCKNGNWKKIILTTDQDLIKDGVQSVDDDFLEWFVKNPSYEFVEINKYAYAKPNFGNYKIIIPKEEPKQETEHLLATETNKKRLLEDVNKQETIEEHYLSIPKPLVDVSRMKVDNHPDKQETLEEALERIRQESFTCCSLSKSINYVTVGEREKSAFIKGAEWQQEQNKKLYSEEIVDILDNVRYWETCPDNYKFIIEKLIEQFKKK